MASNKSTARPSQWDAVVFDAYGTLFDVHSVMSAAEQMFPGHGEALSRLWRTKQLEYSWLRAMSGRYKPFWEITRDALRFSAARLALPLDDAGANRLMGQYASLSAFPENLQVLRSLHAAGLPLAILSNGNREMIEVSVRSAGMQGLFVHLLSSEQVGTFKTMAAVYDLVPQAFACQPARVLFVSSNCWDAIAARWYGFTSFWINRDQAPLDCLDTEPHHIGARLDDVAAIALHSPKS